MSKLQIGLLIGLAVVLIAVAVAFPYSIISGMCIVSLPLIPGVVLYRKLWLDRDKGDFDELDPINISYKQSFEQVGNDDEEE
jgi:hypothetical protein